MKSKNKATKKIYFSFIAMCLVINSSAQVDTSHYRQIETSLFWNKTEEYISKVESQNGDLYKDLGHHGPAIENMWVGYRIYFNKSMSVDVLSKFEPRLELRTSKWYGNDSLFDLNFGKDNYKVGQTVGLGGIRLWDNDSIQLFDTRTNRLASVAKTDTTAEIQIITYDIPYKGKQIDIKVQIAVNSKERHATIEIFVLSESEVEFVTEIVINPGLKTQSNENSLITWGDYDSPAASEKFDVGAAIIFDNNDFNEKQVTDNQIVIVSKPVKYLRYYITSSNERERSTVNTFEGFCKHVRDIEKSLLQKN